MYSTFCVTRVTYVKQGVVTQVTQVTRVTQTRVTRVTRMTAPPGPGGSGAIAKIAQTHKLPFSFAYSVDFCAVFNFYYNWTLVGTFRTQTDKSIEVRSLVFFYVQFDRSGRVRRLPPGPGERAGPILL